MSLFTTKASRVEIRISLTLQNDFTYTPIIEENQQILKEHY